MDSFDVNRSPRNAALQDMKYVPSASLLRALRSNHGSTLCSKCKPPVRTTGLIRLHSTSTSHPRPSQCVPLRKQLKDEAKSKSQKAARRGSSTQNEDWQLTVGIEVHAELDTSSKLFSSAQTSLADAPNTHVSIFDAAQPGAQPHFQTEVLLPALRAALALKCEIQPESSFDRKHYFWWDQPNGYQITQYYKPFATNGSITLYPHDGIDLSDGDAVVVGIKQVQMEQDTAKTMLQPPQTQLLDFNRVSHPLIEIITLPQLHSPKTAAALVRKLQSILKAVGANTTGMELGGLRADVNVSVKRRDDLSSSFQYSGVKGLGQRTEIKNLSSFKAVEDAIAIERDRQISILEAGGVIEGETRGFTLGSTETRRLRGKEGEVDYRYMPDPDLGTLRIGQDLISHLQTTMPLLPDEVFTLLTQDPEHALTAKDAKTMIQLDDGDRLDFYLQVLETVRSQLDRQSPEWQKASKVVAQWTLMDLPSHLSSVSAPFPYRHAADHGAVTAPLLADILLHLLRDEITQVSARALLTIIHRLPAVEARSLQSVRAIIDREGLRLVEMAADEYARLADSLVQDNADMADKARAEASKGKGKGKLMWFVGQMVRQGEKGRIQPDKAEKAILAALDLN